MSQSRQGAKLGALKKPSFTFGVVPFDNDESSRLVLKDFCASLSIEVGAEVLPHRAPSPAALVSAIHAGRVQAAWLSPSLLATSQRLASVLPLASSVREGATSYHAALFVRADSPIQSPKELAGLRVAWVAPTSASGYLFPRAALAELGIHPATFFASETFHDSHGAVAAAVSEGHADAGATFVVFEHNDPARPVVRAGFLDLEGAPPMRLIVRAGPIPSDVIVATPSLPVQLRARLTLALQSLAAGAGSRRAIGALFGAEGFEPFTESSRRILASLLETARATG